MGRSMMKLYLLVFATPTISTHGPRCRSQTKTLADGILTGPVALRELLVDDRHPRRVGRIGRAEPASLQNRHPDRFEVVLVHDRASRVAALSCPAGTESLPAQS